MYTMYRISWRYLDSGIIGHGSYVFRTFEDALHIATAFNRRHPDILHYVEIESD